MSITKCILLSADDDGLILTATDLEMSVVSKKIICDVMESGAIAVDAKLLSDIVAKIPNELVTLSGDANNFAIYSGKFRMQIFGQNAEEFPLINMDEIKTEFSGITEQDFLKLLKGTTFSVCPVEGMKPAFSGVYIETMDSQLSATTSDGFRVSRRYVGVDSEDEIKILFQGSCGNKLIKMLNPKSTDALRFLTTDKHFIIKSDKWTITTRLMAEEYPNFSINFKEVPTTTIEIDCADLLDSLERMKVISSKSSNKVKIEQAANTLILSVGDATGQAYDEIEACITGQPVTIHFNIDYLLSIMKSIQDDTIEIGLSESIRPAYFRGNGTDYEYLVLPMRA